MTKKIILSLFISIIFSSASAAQLDKKLELYTTILIKDSLLFNVGFNTCDLSQFKSLLSKNLKFLHDKNGISDKKEYLYNLKNGLCNSPDKYVARRELIKNRTEIYPLYKNDTLYGAIQNGAHRFYDTIAGKEEKFASSAKFSNVWLLENGQWKLTESVSFDHQTSFDISNANSMFDDDKEIEKWLKSINIPALGIGVINNGKLQQVKVFGELDKGKTAPYNTIFNVASLAKPVTAMVVLKLVSSGKWDLDEPIFKYWTDPDVADDPRSKELTTRHILSQQSGFPNWRYSNKSNKLTFQFSPGTQYQYSGEGIEYLRKALESKFKKSLNELATELIFEPLSMDDTEYIWNSNVDDTRFARGFDNQGNSYETIKNKIPNGADDLLTTIEDYGKFLVSVMNENGITEKVFTDMTTHQVESTKGKHFGLGFEIYDFKDGQYALSHGGADKGAQAIVFIFPKTKNGLIIFTNVDDGYKVYEKLLVHYLGSDGN
jgi:CubicO group peptidase (beta-lactamase class C family)